MISLLIATRATIVKSIVAVSIVALPLQLAAEQVFPDPVGDLIGLDEDAPDAIALVATDLGDALRLEIELTEPDQAGSINGLIEVDAGFASGPVDPERPARRSRLSSLCPKPTGLEVNLTIDLFAREGSEVAVRNSDDQIVGQAQWAETAQGFAVTLGKQLIGFDSGAVRLAAIIGDANAASDCIPDSGEQTLAEVSLHRVVVDASASSGGTITPQGELIAETGETLSLDLQPDPGHHLETVDSTCGGNLDDKTFTTGPLERACSVEAVFVETPIDGECGPANGGVFTSPPDEDLCAAGTPGDVSGDGPWSWSCEGIAGGSDAGCSADIEHYTVIYRTGSGGTIAGETDQSIPHGASGTPVSAEADDGHAFAEWSDGLTDNPRTDSDITEDLSVEAAFIEQTTTSLASDTGVAIVGELVTYSVAVSGTKTIPAGGSVTVEADNGESCSSADGTVTGDTLSFECTIVFSEPGTRTVVADFAGTDDHQSSQSPPLTQPVDNTDELFEDRFQLSEW